MIKVFKNFFRLISLWSFLFAFAAPAEAGWWSQCLDWLTGQQQNTVQKTPEPVETESHRQDQPGIAHEDHSNVQDNFVHDTAPDTTPDTSGDPSGPAE